MDLVDRAQEIAMMAHFGQVNKFDGTPYILHPQRVYIMCRDDELDRYTQALAWVHDVVEDTKWTVNDVIEALRLDSHSSPQFRDALTRITKTGKLSNIYYYKNLRENSGAARVKLRDIEHNLQRLHHIEDPEKKLVLAQKYSLGLDILSDFR